MSATTCVNPEHEFAVLKPSTHSQSQVKAETLSAFVRKMLVCFNGARHDAAVIACTSGSQPPMW